MPTFIPPIVRDVPPLDVTAKGLAARLFRHYGPYPRGRSVLRIGGVYLTFDTPSQELIDTATEVYLGGHIYEVTAEVADALTLAGYTVWAQLTWDDYAENRWEEIEGIPWEVL
jgi:hypothetical protein